MPKRRKGEQDAQVVFDRLQREADEEAKRTGIIVAENNARIGSAVDQVRRAACDDESR